MSLSLRWIPLLTVSTALPGQRSALFRGNISVASRGSPAATGRNRPVRDGMGRAVVLFYAIRSADVAIAHFPTEPTPRKRNAAGKNRAGLRPLRITCDSLTPLLRGRRIRRCGGSA